MLPANVVFVLSLPVVSTPLPIATLLPGTPASEPIVWLALLRSSACAGGGDVDCRAAGQSGTAHAADTQPFRIQVRLDLLDLGRTERLVVDEHFADVAGPTAAADASVVGNAAGDDAAAIGYHVEDLQGTRAELREAVGRLTVQPGRAVGKIGRRPTFRLGKELVAGAAVEVVRG